MQIPTIIMMLDAILAENIEGLNNAEIGEFREQLSYLKIWLRQNNMPELNEAEKEQIRTNQLIQAIKNLRERSHCDLRTAVDITRAYRAQWAKEQMQLEGECGFIARYAQLYHLPYEAAQAQIDSFLEYLKK